MIPDAAHAISMKPYLLRFLAAFVLTSLLMVVVTLLIPALQTTGAGAVTLIVSAVYTIQVFLRDHRRLPSKREKRGLLWGSFAIAMLLQMLALLLLQMPMSAALLVFALVFAALLTLAALAFAYSDWYAGILLRGMAKAEARKQARSR